MESPEAEKENIVEESEESKENSEVVSLSKKELENLTKAIQLQTEILKKQIAIKEVGAPIQEVQEVMTPGDHVERIYKEIEEERETYLRPRRLRDYEAAIGILKRKGVKNEDIANFLVS